MLFRAWTTTYRPPDDRVMVSIQLIDDRTEPHRTTPPWVLSLQDARSAFGAAVDALGPEPRAIRLQMDALGPEPRAIVRFGEEA